MSAASHVADLRTVDTFEEINTRRTSSYGYLDREIVWRKVAVNIGAIVLAKPGYDLGYGHRKSEDDPWPYVMPRDGWVEVWFAGDTSVKMTSEAFSSQIHTPCPRHMEEEERQ